MSKNRVRCAKCNTNFCATCKTIPYHIGKTCSEYKEKKEALKCRFCDEVLKVPSSSPIPAFSDVCRNVDCLQQMQ